MMAYAFDRFLPKGQTWRDLFDVVIVAARKPELFTTHAPFFEIATEEGLLRPMAGALETGKAYLGGSAPALEAESCQLRLQLQRGRAGYGPKPKLSEAELHEALQGVRIRLEALDQDIAPLARTASEISNPT